jgi:hypothetical protein
VRAVDKNNDSLNHLKQKFPKLSSAKLKAGIFTGTQITKLNKTA